MGQIYMLSFPNGKSYIGLTVHTAKYRFKKHKNNVQNKPKMAVHHAWAKHGDPKLTVLAIVENYELADTEIRAIKAYNTLVPNGYNVSTGGDMSPTLQPHIAAKVSATKSTPEAKAAAAVRGKEVSERPHVVAHREEYMRDPEYRKKSSDRLKAMWENPMYREAFITFLKSQVVSQEVRDKISKTVRSPEVAAKISRLGWNHSEETKIQISNSTKGISKPDEVVAHIQQGALNRWARDAKWVICVELNLIFQNTRCAGDWLISIGKTKSKYVMSSIWYAATNKGKCMGYHWGFVGEDK